MSEPKKAGGSSALRAEGDRLRDGGRFAEAVEAYERYLEEKPEDVAIWVQRGNCLKEAGSFAMARHSYERALQLAPDQADTHLQLGHLYKLMGRPELARVSYVKANALDPTLLSPVIELRAIGLQPARMLSPLGRPDAKGRRALIVDLTDLIFFVRENTHLTGIQRVQVGIAFHLLSDEIGFKQIDSARELVIFSCFDPDRKEIVALHPQAVVQLVGDINSKTLGRDELTSRLGVLLGAAPVIRLRPGDLYVILGAYWLGAEYFMALRQLKAAGAWLGTFIYDLIAVTHPQFVAEGVQTAVSDQLADILILADFALTISEYVAHEVRLVIRAEMAAELPIFVVPLSHELPPLRSISRASDTPIRASNTPHLPKDYVLCVGTIEGRKNHQLLLNVWENLNAKYDGKVPHLIIVGKWGWRVEEFRRQLEAKRYVNGRVIVIDRNVSDQVLRELYRGCLFTVFPSFAEGWGLPVGESLALGKPCIASNATSIPEVGGDFCRYFDPRDPIGALKEIDRAISDREGLQAWTQRVSEDFKIRRWSDVTQIFFEKIRNVVELMAATPPRREVARLGPGQVKPLSLRALGEAPWPARALKFALRSGWWPLEPWGAWASRPVASLSFLANDAKPGSMLRIWLELRFPPGCANEIITISDGTENETAIRLGTEPQWVSANIAAGPEGVVQLELRRQGPSPAPIDNRVLYFGLSAIAFHAKDDVSARLDILEAVVTRTRAVA